MNKRNLLITAVVATQFVLGMAYAQDPVASTAPVASETVQVTTLAPTAPVAAPTKTEAVIVNQVVEAPAASYEKQPTTVIEAAPLATSRAEQLRKSREASEIETEQRIVEKLEESRIEAERKRQEEILKSMAPKPEPVIEVAPQQVAPAVVVAPVVTEAQGEIRAEVADEAQPTKDGSNYISGSVGMIDYGALDVETIGAVGVAFGKVYDDRFAVELGVGGARAYVTETAFAYRELQQFNVGLTSKVYLLTGRIRPSVGLGVNYVNRSYSDFRSSISGAQFPNGELNSWALDYGLSLGLDVASSDSVSFGVEYKYTSNLTYEYDAEVFNTPLYRQAYGEWQPLEERDSDYWGFNVKYVF